MQFIFGGCVCDRGNGTKKEVSLVVVAPVKTGGLHRLKELVYYTNVMEWKTSTHINTLNKTGHFTISSRYTVKVRIRNSSPYIK